MALVSKNIPNLINGVSQQPSALRLASQGEAQENGFSDIVDGLKKRPPTEFKNVLRKTNPNGTAFLSPAELSRSFFHTYKRSDSEQFTTVFDPVIPKLYVYDIEGKLRYESGESSWDASGAQIVSNTDNTALVNYFGTNDVSTNNVAATSVADYTFFVNKTKKARVDESSPSNPRPFEGIFYLKQSNYSKDYKCYVENTSGQQVANSIRSTGSTNASDLKTGDIMAALGSNLNTALPAGYVKRGSSNQPYFVIENQSTDFNLRVEDDTGGTALFAHKDAVATFTSLPKYCSANFVVQVNGDNQKKEDDFYVRFSGSQSTGTWKECPAPSRPNNNSVYHSFDSSTMPHTLRQNDDESFSFAPATWQDRLAGDDDTNPFPSFIGEEISDVFFHRNRLGFLSGENIIFSESSSYFNFFRTTVRSLLDSAPIDIAVSQNEVSNLQAAVPTQDNLMLFSNLTQFSLSAQQLLTPAEVTIDQSTKYECDLKAKPVSVGTSIYFTHKDGNFSGLRELYTQGDSDTQDAPSVTSHVPEYISGGVRQMIASSNEDMIVCLTDDNKKECYVYKWYDSDRERLQSSWSKWQFNYNIEHVVFNNTDIYFVFSNGSFEKMSLSSFEAENILLDHRQKLYGSITNVNNWLSLYVTPEGFVLDATEASTYLSADASNYIYAGTPYYFLYRFSEQVFKPADDPTRLARYQLRRITLNYNDTGDFYVSVLRKGRKLASGASDISNHTFTGRILGHENSILGTAPEIEDGSFTVGLHAQAKDTVITIVNNSHLPCIFQNAEVEAYVTQRTKRI